MRRSVRVCGFAALLATSSARADAIEFPPFTEWYENPLGFSPLSLHTKNALLIPGLVAGALLLLTDRPPSHQPSWAFIADLGMSWGYHPPFTRIASEAFGVLYFPRSWLAVGGELTLYHPFDEFNRTSGVGARPFVRFYPLRGERLRAFFSAGAGLIVFADEFPKPTRGFGFLDEPRQGTHVNGTPVYGVGIEYAVTRGLDVYTGVRHVHVSNGNTAGEARNPGHDSNGVYVGLAIHR